MIGDHGDRVQSGPGVRVEPGRAGQHGIAHSRGNRRSRLAEHFGDKERVAAGPRVDLTRIHAVRLSKTNDRFDRQRSQRNPAREPLPGEGAQHAEQRVIGAELVIAVGDDQQACRTSDPTSGEDQQVKSGLIRPVRILDHDRAACGQHVQERAVPVGPG